MINSVVVDASVALAWVLPGADSEEALVLRNQAAESPQPLLLVPPIFWFEVTNVLWVAIRREKLIRQNAIKALTLLRDFEFTVWPVEPASCLNLSVAHDLAVYGSAYLDIAIEQQVGLWTIDQALKRAAEDLGIVVLP